MRRIRNSFDRREYSSSSSYNSNPNHIYCEIDDSFRSKQMNYRPKESQTMKGIPCDCHKCRESRG